MIAIAVYLVGLALLDGLNPVILGLCALFAARSAAPAKAIAFIGGVFASSFVSSLVMVFGLGTVISMLFDRYEPAIKALTIAMGMACIVFGVLAPRVLARRSRRAIRRDTLTGVFLLGAVSNQSDFITLTPFLTAMQIVMSSHLGNAETLGMLALYNGVLISPLLLLVLIARVGFSGDATVLEKFEQKLERHAPRIVQVLSTALGAAIVWYGIVRT